MSKQIQSTHNTVYRSKDVFFEEGLYFDFIDKLVKQLKDQCKKFTFDTYESFDGTKDILFNFDVFNGSFYPGFFKRQDTQPISYVPYSREMKDIGFDIAINVSEVDRSKLDQKERYDIDKIEKFLEDMYEFIERYYANKNNKNSVWYSYPDKKAKLELSNRGLIKIYKDGRSIFVQYNKEQETIQLKPLNSAGSALYVIRKNSVKLNTGYDLNKLRHLDSFSFRAGVDKKEDLISDKFIKNVASKFEASVDHFFYDNKKYIDNLHKEHSKNISIIKDYLLTALDILEQNA